MMLMMQDRIEAVEWVSRFMQGCTKPPNSDVVEAVAVKAGAASPVLRD
jgi:hypothetical protein